MSEYAVLANASFSNLYMSSWTFYLFLVQNLVRSGGSVTTRSYVVIWQRPDCGDADENNREFFERNKCSSLRNLHCFCFFWLTFPRFCIKLETNCKWVIHLTQRTIESPLLEIWAYRPAFIPHGGLKLCNRWIEFINISRRWTMTTTCATFVTVEVHIPSDAKMNSSFVKVY